MGFSWFAPDAVPAVDGTPLPDDRKPLAAVVFDWGGTLTLFHDVDLLDLWRMTALEISSAHADEITAILAGLETSWWHARDGSDGLAGNGAAGGMTGSVTELLAAASAALGVDVAAAVLRAVSRRDLAAWTPHTVCDPEALLLVHLVRARGLLVGLLTNTRWPRAWHERLLERDGLLDLFHARIYTSDLPFDKPHPIAFQAVLAALGVTDPSRVLFVGDRLRTDIRGARAAGMRAVLVADGGSADGGLADDAVAGLGDGPGGVVLDPRDPLGLAVAGRDLAGRDDLGRDPAARDLPGADGAAAGASASMFADAVIGRLGHLLEVLDLLGAPGPGSPAPRR